MSCASSHSCTLPRAKRKWARLGTIHACLRCGKLHRCVMEGAWDTTFYTWQEIQP